MFKIFASSLTGDILAFYVFFALVLIYVLARVYFFVSNTLYARRVMRKVGESAQKLEESFQKLEKSTQALKKASDMSELRTEKIICPHCGKEL